MNSNEILELRRVITESVKDAFLQALKEFYANRSRYKLYHDATDAFGKQVELHKNKDVKFY